MRRGDWRGGGEGGAEHHKFTKSGVQFFGKPSRLVRVCGWPGLFAVAPGTGLCRRAWYGFVFFVRNCFDFATKHGRGRGFLGPQTVAPATGLCGQNPTTRASVFSKTDLHFCVSRCSGRAGCGRPVPGLRGRPKSTLFRQADVLVLVLAIVFITVSLLYLFCCICYYHSHRCYYYKPLLLLFKGPMLLLPLLALLLLLLLLRLSLLMLRLDYLLAQLFQFFLTNWRLIFAEKRRCVCKWFV